MKRCLDENELIRLWTAEPAEFPDLRAHLAQCSRCATGYKQLARDAGTIAGALTVAADHLRWRDRAATHGAYVRLGNRRRTAVIFSGAAAFGGAAAFALMLALGWHPERAATRLAQASANSLVTNGAGNPPASAGAVVAAESRTTAPLNNGSLYEVDAIARDPLAGLTYGAAVQAGNSNAGDDLLFCVPDDDGAICGSSAEQGWPII